MEVKNEVRNRGKKSKSEQNAEFFLSLEKWLYDVRSYSSSCQFFNSFPYGVIPPQNFSPQSNGTQFLNNNFLPHTPTVDPQVYNRLFTTPRQPEPAVDQGTEYRIPPLWKRFLAELFDFVILFVIKLPITFIAVDFFDFVDLEKYDFDILQQQDKIDYKLALEMTSEILFLEVIHRIIVCVFEGLFLRKGATPGKRWMGIKVIYCLSIQQVGGAPDIVKVQPATELGLAWSFARSLLKNLVIALLFPVCLPLFFNKFNRTGYDILCHSVVVEDQPIRRR